MINSNESDCGVLRLSSEELQILLDTTVISRHLEDALLQATEDQESFRIALSEGYLEELLSSVAAEVHHTDDVETQAALQMILDKIERV